MCGILFYVQSKSDHENAIMQTVRNTFALPYCFSQFFNNQVFEQALNNDIDALKRRGPDASNQTTITISDCMQVTFSGFTLWLQGDSPTHQPLSDSDGNVLLWNGDIFSGKIMHEGIPKGSSDTLFLLNTLQMTTSPEEICNILESINGPWSVIYFKKDLNLVITGRDRYGRHSLLWNCSNYEEPSYPFVISSIDCQVGSFKEMPASSFYKISFTESLLIEKICPRNIYSINRELLSDDHLINWDPHLLEKPLSEPVMSCYMGKWHQEVEKFESILLESVKSRIHCQPLLCNLCVELHGNAVNKCSHSKLAILFSGGLDSSVLAALSDRVWPENESIDLLNVAFPMRANSASLEKFSVPDRLTGLQALGELKKLNPSRKWNFLEVIFLLLRYNSIAFHFVIF